MIKIYNIFLLIIFLFSSVIQANTNKKFNEDELKILEELRIKYYKAVEDEDYLYELENFIKKNISKKEKFILYEIAYTGGVEALKSKHAFWPIKKLNHLNESMKYLSKAIELEPENLEIRFMRFSILHYVPSFIGYSKERDDDAKMIFKLLMKKDYSLLNKDIQKGIIEFMISSERIELSSAKILEKELALLK